MLLHGHTVEHVTGYLVDSYFRSRRGFYGLCYFCRLADDRTAGIFINNYQPSFYIRSGDCDQARSIVHACGGTLAETGLQTMDNEPVFAVSALQTTFQKCMVELHKHAIRTYEADLKPTDKYLMERGIHSVVEIVGIPAKGRHVEIYFINPKLTPGLWTGELSILSFDIETDPSAAEIYALALAYQHDRSSPIISEVFIVGQVVENAVTCQQENELLHRFEERVRQLDPDIITGWNINAFDFPVLLERARFHKSPLHLGRTQRAFRLGERVAKRSSSNNVEIEGRQVLDALRLTRFTLGGYQNYRLETIAQQILGKGKKLDLSADENPAQTIQKLYRERPAELCAYCREDALLVLEILKTGGVLELTVQKSLSIGLPLSRVHRSIASFERLYLEKLMAYRIVSPSLGIDQPRFYPVVGGGILTPRPGLYRNVLVFDFKSLYPSLMRTFNLDPLAHIQARFENGLITMPNGASFTRGTSIITQLLDDLMKKREQARAENNTAAAYAYKIIMNSFYGVLGTKGCRFSDPAIAGAITTTGQYFLRLTRDLLESWGYEVLYGDTDSLFVYQPGQDPEEPAYYLQQGHALAKQINASLARYIAEEYGLVSKLEIEFEKYYTRFLLPGLRAKKGDSGVERGRAKGYAGYEYGVCSGIVQKRLDIIGLEAVRRDWTPLARNLQRALLELIFADRTRTEIQGYIRNYLSALDQGKLDCDCVYQKSLRKSVRAYTRSRPPHVRAASLLSSERQRGLISYIWTRHGPEPIGPQVGQPDYEHYREKQVRPILRSLDQIVKLDLEQALHDKRQLDIFENYSIEENQ
ncbi:DNA polymerase II [bacterium]|nr:DNA polymerase II [bacterium]